MNNNSAPHRMEPQGPLTPPELLLGKCTGIHWKVWIPALLTTYCILLKDLHKQKSLPENKQILYQQSFPKPATVWLDTKIPLFWVLLHCWERTKPNAVKTPWKAESHFFAALYHTSVFIPAIFLDLPTPLRCFCHSTITCSWPFFFLPSRPQSAASPDCNFAL